jgi:hypothetical protein
MAARMDSSASRALRLAERTAANVATASTSVPAPVASSEAVPAQSVICVILAAANIAGSDPFRPG